MMNLLTTPLIYLLATVTTNNIQTLTHQLLHRRTLQQLQWDELTNQLQTHARTAPGRHLLSNLLLTGTTISHQQILDQYDLLREYQSVQLRGSLAGDYDISCIYNVISSKQCLDEAQIRSLSVMITEIDNLVTELRELDRGKYPHLTDLVAEIDLEDSFVNSLTNAIDESDELSGIQYPELAALRKAVKQQEAALAKSINSWMAENTNKLREPGYSVINGRYCVAVSPSEKSRVGVVHGTSRTGRTLYMEPANLVEPTNELKKLQLQLNQLTQAILRGLTNLVIRNITDLEYLVELAGVVDVLAVKCAIGGVIPVVRDQGVVQVSCATHPLLSNSAVPNDLQLESGGLVISGPNSGGKTVVLKTLGLLALMTHAGLPIPVVGSARFDYFSSVFTSIGDSQNLGDGLSTFSGHLTHVNNILQSIDHQSLVLIDELGSGTDPRQGSALAQAILENMCKTRATVAVTTHYEEIKQYAMNNLRVCGMEYKQGQPTYKLLYDVVSESYGLAVAQRLNMSKSIVDRAEELLVGVEGRGYAQLMQELEEKKEELEAQQVLLQEQEELLAKSQYKLQQSHRELEVKSQQIKTQAAIKYQRQLEQKEERLQSILKELESDSSKQLIFKAWNDFQIIKKEVAVEADPVLAKQEEEVSALTKLTDEDVVNLNDELLVCEEGPLYKRTGTVVKVANKFIELSFGGAMRQRMKRQSLAFLPSNGSTSSLLTALRNNPNKRKNNGESKAVRRAKKLAEKAADNDSGVTHTKSKKASADLNIRTSNNTIDLRGCTLDQAKGKCTDFFAKRLGTNNKSVYLLHGHGTGALKSKLRSWLQTEKDFVQRSRPADEEDGGDAFTFVQLKSVV